MLAQHAVVSILQIVATPYQARLAVVKINRTLINRMANISNVNQALAWGLTPFWASNQLNGSFNSGTGTGSYKDGWGASHTYTYTIKGLSSISVGNGTFNLSNWNSWNSSQQGSQANLAYLNGDYGFNVNTGGVIISQNVGDITYGTPVLTSSQNVASDEKGTALSSSIDNTTGSSPVTQTITFQASESATSNASTTQGFSNTTTLSVGAEVSAKFAEIGGKVNSSVTNATTINSSSTSGTSSSQAITFSVSNAYTVQPGYKIQVSMMYTNQQISMPYTAPLSFSGSGNIVLNDKWGNTLSNTAGEAISWSNYYGLNPSGVVSSSTAGSLLATGVITNLNSLNFTTTQTTLVKPATSSLQQKAAFNSTDNDPLDEKFLPEVTKDGDLVDVGALYKSKKEGAVLKGSVYGDLIYMNGKNQVAYTHSGNDMVFGSEHSDRIIVGSYDASTSSDSDVIESRGGNDKIEVISGGHIINSGSGNDVVKLALLGEQASRITLGAGKDLLIVDFKKSTVAGSYFIVTDFSAHDKVKYIGLPKDSLLTAETVGNSTEIFLNDSHVGTFIVESGAVDQLTGQNLVETGLLNIDLILRTEGDIRSNHVDDWRGELNESAVLGNSLNVSYDILSNSAEFKRVVKSLQKYVYDDKNVKLTRWAMSEAENYDTMQSLAADLIKRAGDYGLTEALIPATYFASDQSIFTPAS